MSTRDVRIMSFGAATQDVFLMGPALHAKRDVRSHDYVEQFPLGAKIEIDEVVFDTGGGATNAAVTFARQGLRSIYIGKVGHDPAGNEIIRALRREGIVTDRIAHDPKLTTGYSVILLASSGERTILSHRGASSDLSSRDIPIRNLSADWFYISSLAGNFDLLTKLLTHANRHGIKVAIDPGAGELAQPAKLKALLPLVTVLKANAEELSLLFGGDNVRETVLKADDVCQYVIGTDGPAGAYAVVDNRLYQVGSYANVKPIDRTGAGDAFGSGFIAGLAKGMNTADALTLASANATSVVTMVGAKPGILHSAHLKTMKVKVTEL